MATKLPFQNGAPVAQTAVDDVDEEALLNDYQQQLRSMEEMQHQERSNGTSHAPPSDDIHARLLEAAVPLGYEASLETKFTSYDNYCALFHFILNSEAGPVDLEPPSVRWRLLVLRDSLTRKRC